MDNLRAFLSQHNSEDPLQFGFKLKRANGLSYMWSQITGHSLATGHMSYMSGGAGYVLSKEALKRLSTMGLVRI